MIGKWHLGHHTPDQFPHNRGFENFYGYVSGGIGYWDHNQGGGHDWQRNGKTVREEGYATHLLADEAVRMINTHDQQQPMFLYLALGAPHLPNEAPAESISQYQHIEDSERRIHAAMVSELDIAIGQVMKALVANNMDKNTILFFASDNGGLIKNGMPGIMNTLANWSVSLFDRPIPIAGLEFFASNAFDGGSDNLPLSGGKGSLLEGGVRVPALIWWPEKLSPKKYDGFVTISDLLPTLLEATGRPLQNPKQIDGVSQWQSLTNGTPLEITPDYFVATFNGSALYRWPWKLIDLENPRLYNIETDPNEQTDVSQLHPELVNSLLHIANNWTDQPNRGISVLGALLDMDSFGGGEDREPWAEAAQKNAQQ
ncbi:hypothetical protein R50073_10140 [Maricurvus nonylphenolicus]